MSDRTTKFRWVAVGALMASILVVPLAAAAPAGAESDAWHTNTFHVTRAGVFHAHFLMPEWFEVEVFFIQIVGPRYVSHCTLRYGSRIDRARKITFGYSPYVYFSWPEKGLKSATRTTAICRHLVGGPVTAATVFLTPGPRQSRITLRHR
jgi:hypothetical protein